MKKFYTVRSGYLYIFGGSVLLSGMLLAAAYWTIALLYSHYGAESTAIWIKLLHWMTNHIGRRPLAVLLFTALFTVIFLLRSQKISSDLKNLLQATEDLSSRGSFGELRVDSGGELGQLAANLRRIKRPDTAALEDMTDYRISQPEEPVLDSEVLMALILRTRTLLRLLHEAATEEQAQGRVPKVAAAQREAMGMEGFLENLMTRS
ncbi:hypothetical protein [Paenibacillus jilunlii]|uniref:HAMP domain-containing protein n=1 Tax=Paenibacillus jilunlii TaxID=682956 RepID=A0A1G9VGT4_9BACL|nr:hypothetical protein [Paenibacillus jilunlii]KWX75798.1 hypothetical protein AML91_11410 [Paenibacillus jilunlii]SDM71271.1 hypothetical protein SAMN05216191_1175 [Paenibacillus jilunlii]